ncbi:MAG: M81 family metallopeptidase [Pseudomonadaceae bacterium]|nr:M81 family metallopeptidase [Pseudomonadaceae bacterium]
MRIALAGIEHETNTYCSGQTELTDFYVQRGEKMLRAAGQQNALGGAVDACLESGVEVAPILHAFAQPSGTISAQAYDGLKTELLERLSDAAPVDAVLWLVHGAGVVDGIPDLEGDLIAASRQLLGADTAMAGVFDLHGNITQAMASDLNGVFACHEYPHVDMHVQSSEAVAHLIEMVTSGRRARCTVVQLPLLMPTTTTFSGPGKRALASVLAAEAENDVVDISWFHGFPFTDVAHVGSSVVVTSYADGASLAQQVAQDIWEQRESFRPDVLNADQALARAQSLLDGSGSGPVVINETSDNCGAGAPGDGTHLLRAMLAADLAGRACFGFVVDPATATQAHSAGVGSTIEVRLGGHTDDLHGAPIEANAYVKALSDGRLVLQHMYAGAPLHLGPMAQLLIDGLDVVVASRRSQTFDLEPFLAVGIDVMRYDIVALKSSNHFRACFESLASAIVTADTPGLSTNQISVFERQASSVKYWPTSDDAAWPADAPDRKIVI